MKKILAIATIITNSLFGAFPNQFVIDEEISFIGTEFALIDSNQREFGRVEEKVFSLTTAFFVYEGNAKVAYAKQHLISWGTKIDIYDNSDNLRYTFKEIVHKSLFKVVNEYQIVDSNGKIIAISEKKEFIDTEIKLYTPEGDYIGRIYRKPINFITDQWFCDVKTRKINPMIFAIIGAYKTTGDNKK